VQGGIVSVQRTRRRHSYLTRKGAVKQCDMRQVTRLDETVSGAMGKGSMVVPCKSVPRCSSRKRSTAQVSGPTVGNNQRARAGGSSCCGHIRCKGFGVRGSVAAVVVVVAAVGCGLEVGRGREERTR
jgi:hypothetical protein